MKHILMAGSFGQGNVGDDAILGAMVDQLRSELPDVRLQAVGGDTKLLQERFCVETLDWDDWAEIASIVRKSDLVIAGGGGIFFDYEGFHPHSLLQKGAPNLSHYATFPVLAGLFRKPLMLYGVGVGPLVSDEAREVVRLAFELADVATVRDQDSLTRLAEIGVQTETVETTADPALSLRVAPESRARAALTASGCDLSRPVLAIIPKPWPKIYPAFEWHSAVASAVKNLMEAEKVQVVLFAFQPTEDDDEVQSIRRHLPDRDVYKVQDGLLPSDISAMLGLCDLVVGARLHALILGVLAGTPGLALTCEPKVRAFMAQLGQSDLCVEVSEVGRLTPLLQDAWTRRNQLRLEIPGTRDLLRLRALRNARLAADLIEIPRDRKLPSPALLNVLSRMIEGRLKEERALDARLTRLFSS